MPLAKGQDFAERALFCHLASTYKNPPCSIIRKGAILAKSNPRLPTAEVHQNLV